LDNGSDQSGIDVLGAGNFCNGRLIGNGGGQKMGPDTPGHGLGHKPVHDSPFDLVKGIPEGILYFIF
jgi:hypothetical protein